MTVPRVRAAAGFAAALLMLSLSLAPSASSDNRQVPSRPGPQFDRYSIVNGCYALRLASGQQLGPFRMQAAALGQYLLYGVHGEFLGPNMQMVSTPSADTVWTVGERMSISNAATGEALAATFVPASGCAVYPEGQVDATGTPFTGASPEAQVTGTIDAHTHVTAFEFLGGDWHCGRPWDQFGIPYALPDCAPYERGTNGVVESFIDYGTPAHPHDTVGWPTFTDWPSPTNLVEEGDYYTGIKRAWMAGLRVMVTQLVDNEALCTLMTERRNPCNDMDAVRLQAADLKALQDYIDAQSGGPGKGFFRIVTNPFQARQVINEGKLAVVEGIEVSHLLDCGEYLGVPQCSEGQIDAGLNEIRKLGVSTFFPVHKFDNAFGGTKMDSGELGVLVNGGNHLETGSFWNIETCTGPEHDSEQISLPALGTLGGTINGLFNQLAQGAALPLYPPPPHCNTRGLTPLGAYLINQMIKQHLIVELDHMDVKTADDTLSILEAHHYSGVISAHSWDSPEENPRIYNLGGFVTPIAGASPAAFLSQWRDSVTIRNRRYYAGAGFGYGADMNGLAEESQPTSGNPIPYPFSSYDGRVSFTREQWGRRMFDLNKDGVANYGMFADWLEELQVLAGRPVLDDMFHGAEAYLEMWERAYGVPAASCLSATGRLGAGQLRLGATFESLLYAAGQPSSRPGRSYRYCVRGGGGGVAAVFNRAGRVATVLSTARGYTAGGVHAGATRPGAVRLVLGPRRRDGRRSFARVRGGRVRYVGVTTERSRAALLGDIQAAGLS